MGTVSNLYTTKDKKYIDRYKLRPPLLVGLGAEARRNYNRGCVVCGAQLATRSERTCSKQHKNTFRRWKRSYVQTRGNKNV